MKVLVFPIMLSAILLITSGCEQSSPKLVGVPPTEVRKTEGSELQTFNPSVDILFVIDDSGSMYSHQQNLKDNVDLFTQGLVGNKFVDYHIGVISTSDQYTSMTDSGGGVLAGRTKWIDRNTANNIDVLKQNLQLGINGSGYEMVFDPIRFALSEPVVSGQNAGFYRPSAYLAIVVITDAEDQSTEMDANRIYNFLVDLKKGDSTKLLSYGVVIPTTDATNCTRDETNSPPTRIEEFFSLTKGNYYGLCDSDYGTKLAGIGSDLVERIGRRVLLDRRPDINTIEVRYGSQVVMADPVNGWSFEATDNAVVLGRNIKWSEQPEGTVVQVYFQPAQN